MQQTKYYYDVIMTSVSRRKNK